MDNQYDGTADRRWALIQEIDFFVLLNSGSDILETRNCYHSNYLRQLDRLLFNDQIIIQRNDLGNIIGVCGWIVINKEDEPFINKITWSIPTNISKGNIIYVSFCIVNGGNIHQIRKQLKERYRDYIDEIFWYNLQANKFFRRTLKEK